MARNRTLDLDDLYKQVYPLHVINQEIHRGNLWMTGPPSTYWDELVQVGSAHAKPTPPDQSEDDGA